MPIAFSRQGSVAAVVVEVDILDLTLDDEFPTGETHYRCHYSKVEPVALLLRKAEKE